MDVQMDDKFLRETSDPHADKAALHKNPVAFRLLCKSAKQTKKLFTCKGFPLLAERWTNKLSIKKLLKAFVSLMRDVELWRMHNIGTVNDIQYFACTQ